MGEWVRESEGLSSLCNNFVDMGDMDGNRTEDTVCVCVCVCVGVNESVCLNSHLYAAVSELLSCG